MRLAITLAIPYPTLIPYEQYELLQGSIYAFLARSSTDYARELHDRGFTLATERTERDDRRFKLFVFSTLRLPGSQRQNLPQGVLVSPGTATWFIASPKAEFLEHYATGLLEAGKLTLGNLILPIREVQVLPTPSFPSGEGRFTCLTPIVATVPVADRTTAYYLRPDVDAERFSEQVRKNLLTKYALVYGAPPEDDRLTLTFDQAYLKRDKHNGTKLAWIKNTGHVGALCPFTLTGNPDLLSLALDCGLGEKNSIGCGMIDTR